ncbi:MAG: hypothetical protein V3T05_07485 [Myxococcota bacterium]
MRPYIGLQFFRRLLLLVLFGLCAFAVLAVVRSAMLMQALSIDLMAALVVVQLPHVVSLVAGLSAYWTIDHLERTGQQALLASSAVQARATVLGILAPTAAVTVCMLAFNTTVLRKMSRDIGLERAKAELSQIEHEVNRRQMFRIGPFQLIATGALRQADRVVLDEPLLALRSLVIEPARAIVHQEGLSMEQARVLHLDSRFQGTAGSIDVRLPVPQGYSPLHHFHQLPARTMRSAAMALDITAFVLLAIVCAQQGARRGRRRWLALWLGCSVLPLLAVQDALARMRTPDLPGLQLGLIVAVPLAVASVCLLLLLRPPGRAGEP